jgi:hypothetical protein
MRTRARPGHWAGSNRGTGTDDSRSGSGRCHLLGDSLSGPFRRGGPTSTNKLIKGRLLSLDVPTADGLRPPILERLQRRIPPFLNISNMFLEISNHLAGVAPPPTVPGFRSASPASVGMRSVTLYVGWDVDRRRAQVVVDEDSHDLCKRLDPEGLAEVLRGGEPGTPVVFEAVCGGGWPSCSRRVSSLIWLMAGRARPSLAPG